MQHIPKIVQARLQRSTPEAAQAHPDADLLTAFGEQSLAESERTLVMEHLARCGDCRKVVALALPASEAVTLPSSTRADRGVWLSWPLLRWGVVAAGIVLVTSVGILQYKQRAQQNAALVSSSVPRQEKPITTSHNSQPPAQAIVPEALETAKTPMRKLSRDQRAEAANQPTPSRNAIFPPPQPMSRAGSGGGAAGGIFAGRGIGSGSSQAPKSSQVQAQSDALALPLAGRETASAPPQNPTAQPAPAAPGRVLESGATQVVEVQSETAQIATQNQVGGRLAQNQTELPSQKQPLKNLDVVRAKDSVPPQAQSSVAFAPTVSTPNISLQKDLRSSPRWAISSSGALQRSFDAGSTWEDVNVSQAALTRGARMESTTDRKSEFKDNKSKKSEKGQSSPSLVFRAVAALDPEVWAGGSGAILYHSLDSGTHWTRVLPSEAAASLTGDVISVEFSDAQHGRVATSTGEVWFTADDGQTWHKQ